MNKSPRRIVLILKKIGFLRDKKAIQGDLPEMIFWTRFCKYLLKEIFGGRSVQFKDALGYQYVSPPNNLSSLLTFLHGYRDPAIYRFYSQWIREGDTVIDVGANVGTHLFQMAGLASDGLALAFEADPEICLYLDEGMHKNGFENVILRNCAISRERGGLALNRNMGNRGLTSVKQTQQFRGLTVSSSTLDEEVKMLCPDATISLIKIDVEGHEKEVLLGASSILKQTERLAIVMEHFGGDGADAPRILLDNGFTPHLVTSTGELESVTNGVGDNIVWIK